MSEQKDTYACGDCGRPMPQDENGCIDTTDHTEDCAGIARRVIKVCEASA